MYTERSLLIESTIFAKNYELFWYPGTTTVVSKLEIHGLRFVNIPFFLRSIIYNEVPTEHQVFHKSNTFSDENVKTCFS